VVAAADRVDVLAAVRSAYPVDDGDFRGAADEASAGFGTHRISFRHSPVRLDGHSARVMADE
jgi:hypothetical protein